MRANKKIFIIGFWPDYETCFFSSVSLNTHQIIIVNPKEEIKTKTSRWLPRPFRNKLMVSRVLKLFASNPDALFFFQDNRLFLDLIQKHQPKIMGGIIMRNIVNEKTKIFTAIQSLRAMGYHFWSFDPVDCNQYGFTYYEQFISKIPQLKSTKPTLDFIFIGQDKGRSVTLNTFKKEVKKLGYKTLIKIVEPSTKKNIKQMLSYKDYIQMQNKGKCIIDLAQKNQAGLTLRPLEALIYKQKLLSNNPRIKDSIIYNDANIFIIKEDGIDYKRLALFMEKPLVEIEDKIIQTYSTEAVLTKIIQQASPPTT